MAPAEKFGASLPTTSARKFGRRFLDARLEHLDRVAADGVHLRVELDAEHAVAEIDQARAGVPADDAAAFAWRREGPADPAAAGATRVDSSSMRSAGSRPSPVPRSRSGGIRAGAHASMTRSMPIASHVSNGPSSQPKPQRIARSTSSMECAIVGVTRAA